MESEAHSKKNPVILITRLCFKLGVVPYEWRFDQQRIALTTSAIRNIHWILNLVLYNLYVIFLIGRYIQLSNNPKGSGLSDIQSVITASFITLIIFKELFKTWDVFFNTVNLILRLSWDLPRSVLSQTASPTERGHLTHMAKKATKAMKICKMITCILITMYTLRMLARPEKANHFTSLIFQNPKLQKKIKILPFAWLHCYIWCIQYTGILYYATTHLYLTKTLREYLCYMEIREKKQSARINHQRMFLFPMYYTQLQVIQKHWDYTWSSFHSYFVVTFVAAIILGLYQTVVMRTLKPLVVTLAAAYCLALFISAISEPYTMSVEILHSWRRQQGAPSWFRRHIKSCQPLYTKNGNYGFIDKKMTLTILGIIISNAVTLIVGHNNEE